MAVTSNRTNSRAVAAGIIGEWQETGTFPDHLVEYIQSDNAFIMEIVYGVVRWKRSLEWVIRRCTKRKPDKEVIPFLLVGLYQILLMDNIEEYAVVNETVEAVKSAELSHAVAFANAVLRRVLREKDSIRKELDKQPLVVRLSHPDMLVDRWKKQFGKEKTLKLLEWNNSRPGVVIRPNRMKIGFANFTELLKDAGINAVPHPFAPEECLSISRGITVAGLPGYSQGLFTIQDPSTLISVKLLDPQPGEFVLDACAAPGGKTSIIAEKMAGKGRIVAMDIQEERLETLRENMARMEIKSVTMAYGDASNGQDVKKVCDGRLFDRILLDVPCTNTGVLRRRPDARWRFSNKGLAELVTIQRRVLTNTTDFLKPGGVLVYSTCSLEPEECDGIIEWWLSSNSGFERAGCEQLFPPDSQTDGAYACALRKML
ncbi:MAG: 16S rRNA (cytosine(967)-C(5))-methyltransferase RsmB [Kiritimatiellae bacterium]|nr:16S rRNA (cytosine(967)-C(5))-methyltransferase RsmB [Kiritimatiellia bacterium]MDD5519345.1 16S rRNA (cytosine(967)-C(5))-methyltransferase RsmB [Kiritimatiellia bacterium]